MSESKEVEGYEGDKFIPERRRKKRTEQPTTKGWPRALRKAVMQDLYEGINPVEVALRHGATVNQVFLCIQHARAVDAARTLRDANYRDRKKFLDDVVVRARAGLVYALENIEDPYKLGEFSRRVLEGTDDTLKKKSDSAGPGSVTFNGPTQLNFAHMSTEELVKAVNEQFGRVQKPSPVSEDT